MQQRRLIRIIVPYSKTIFFIDKGEPLGTAAEWGSELDNWLNKGKCLSGKILNRMNRL